MARWTASAKWAAGPALDGQRVMPLALRLSEGLGVSAGAFKGLNYALPGASDERVFCVFTLRKFVNDASPEGLSRVVDVDLTDFPVARQVDENMQGQYSPNTYAPVLPYNEELIHPVAAGADLDFVVDERKAGKVSADQHDEWIVLNLRPVPIQLVTVLAVNV